MALKLPAVGCLPAKHTTEKALNDTVERVETFHDSNISHYHQVVHGAEVLKAAAENKAVCARQQVAQGPLRRFRHVLRRVRNFVNARDGQPSNAMQCVAPAVSSPSISTAWRNSDPGEVEDLFLHDDSFVRSQEFTDVMVERTQQETCNELMKQHSSYCEFTSLQSQLSSVPSTIDLESKTELVCLPRARRRPRILMALRAYLRRVSLFLRGQLRPKSGGHNDQTVKEKCLNILTCAPFVMAGRHVLRHCDHPKSRRFGHMFLVVAGVAAAYHGSSQHHRRGMRQLDYWSIAMSSNLLRAAALRRRPAAVAAPPAASTCDTMQAQNCSFHVRANDSGAASATLRIDRGLNRAQVKAPTIRFPHVLAAASSLTRSAALALNILTTPGLAVDMPHAGQQGTFWKGSVSRGVLGVAKRAVSVASVVGIPFAPCLVSSLNFLLVEARCGVLAFQLPQQLARQYLLHILTGCTAGASFFLEDLVVKNTGSPVPGMHAAFHVLAAAGIGTLTPFLQQLEQTQAQAHNTGCKASAVHMLHM